MKISYGGIVDDSIDLPDMVGVNTPDGVKMLHCEETEGSDYHVARYQGTVSNGCQFTVDIYKEVGSYLPYFDVYAKLKCGENAGEIIYHEKEDPDNILDILGNAFAEAEKRIKECKIPVKLDPENIEEIKKKLTEVLDIL